MSDRDDDRQSPLSFGSRDTTFISPRTGVSREFLPGDIIGGSYQLLGLLGRGGMGLVFSCRHLTLGQDYALKLLDGNDVTDEHWKRFRTEAMALAKLNHAGIVSIYNMGIDAGQWPYYVMELLSGETMASLIEAEGRLPVNEALGYFIQLADALYCAHQQGIIHRDIKPSNIMLVREGGRKISRVKLVDFGIARLSKTVFANQSQTATGLIFGTPSYMSPEQCQGLKVDQRSDVYSFGCTFFEALTGAVPFAGSTPVEIFMQHLSHPVPSLTSKGKTAFSPALELVVAKMLSKDAADRYENMEQVKHDLERILHGKEIRFPAGSEASQSLSLRAGQPAAASSRSPAGGRLSQKPRNKSKTSMVPLVIISTLSHL